MSNYQPFCGHLHEARGVLTTLDSRHPTLRPGEKKTCIPTKFVSVLRHFSRGGRAPVPAADSSDDDDDDDDTSRRRHARGGKGSVCAAKASKAASAASSRSKRR